MKKDRIIKTVTLCAGLLSACATQPGAGPEKPAAAAGQAPVTSALPGEIMNLIQQGNCTQLKQRLEAGVRLPDVDAFGYTPLGLAASTQNPVCIQALLDHGADVNQPISGGWTPLILAAMGGAREPILGMLLAHGADIDAQNQWGCTALYYATGFGSLSTVEYLLKRGASYPGTGKGCMTPLRLAELRGYPPLVERLKGLEGKNAQTSGHAAGP